MQKYHYGNGIVKSHGYLHEVIKMDDGTIIKTKKRVLLDKPEPGLGDRVVCAWFSSGNYPKKFKGYIYIDRTGVEKIGYWERDSTYQRQNSKNGLPASEIIKVVFNRLKVSDRRINEPTGFEEERLGINLWIFTKIRDNRWSWVPINISLTTDSRFDQFEKKVVPIRIDLDQISKSPSILYTSFCTQLNTALENFHLCGQTLLSREEAMAAELKEFPLSSLQPA